MSPTAIKSRSRLQWIGLITAPLLALAVYVALPVSYETADGTAPLTHAARATTATAAWMAVWWMTEAIPVFATALLPIAVLPMAGAVSIRDTAAPYAHELIFLFMGGFIIAVAMERWGLHRRFAYRTLQLVGTRTSAVVAGFMAITAFTSMWVSNTATVIMMLPIALSVIDLVLKQTGQSLRDTDEFGEGAGHNFALCLLLGIAYAASIGGIGTLIGTPPNLFLASYVESNLGIEISFVRWMGVGIPLVLVFLPVTWWLLTKVLYPIKVPRIEGGGALTREAYVELGAMKRGEWAVLIVFLLTAAAWISRPLLVKVSVLGAYPLSGLTDAGIAITAALVLFVIPVDIKRREFVMDWEHTARLPWGVLLLFGGGLSLAAAIKSTGVGEFLGHQVATFAGAPSLVIVLLIVTVMIFLTELTSNTATTATLVPILAALAPGLGLNPFFLIVPATMAASCAFMLPVATPPNAIVFGSGYVRIGQMVRAGLWLNLIGIVLITVIMYAVAQVVLPMR